MDKLLIITGPTAVGKSAVAIFLAKYFQTNIISCDSMQVYKQMNIGTAKPSLSEQDGIIHYLMDYVEPTISYSVSQYREDFEKVLESEFLDKIPILCGGTGLYIRSILYPVELGHAPSDLQYREELETLAKKFGNEELYHILQEIDPKTAEVLHPNDLKRVMRALEIYRSTGKKKSELEDDFAKEPKHPYFLVGLDMDRQLLYERINHRVDKMLESGLVEEVKELLQQGLSERLIAMQAIGYKEIMATLKNEMSYTTAVELIKQSSRNYAKRQWTYMRKLPDIHWYDSQSSALQKRIIADYEQANENQP